MYRYKDNAVKIHEYKRHQSQYKHANHIVEIDRDKYIVDRSKEKVDHETHPLRKELEDKHQKVEDKNEVGAMNVEESIFPRKKENQKEHESNNDFVPDAHEKRIKIEYIL